VFFANSTRAHLRQPRGIISPAVRQFWWVAQPLGECRGCTGLTKVDETLEMTWRNNREPKEAQKEIRRALEKYNFDYIMQPNMVIRL